MKPKFWQERWQKNEIGFHNAKPHPWLVQFGARLNPGKIMVPLCGKSLDLLWLREQGHHVVGIELSELACHAFFQEHHIEHSVTKLDNHVLFSSQGIDIWCGDFFTLREDVWSTCTAVYDRAAMVALPPELRRRYTQKIIRDWPRAAATPGNLLLITIEYPPGTLEGPPFSISEAEVREQYESLFNVEILTPPSSRIYSSTVRGTDVHEAIYLLTQKSG
ncbi:MAG: thiopurine S-methyltransferase [Bdellovibrionales bacterium]|nr:thiopurine S-methyltransferase [Bdellovibrionales bacterium]